MEALLQFGVMGLNRSNGPGGAIDCIGAPLRRAGMGRAAGNLHLEITIALGGADDLKLGRLTDHRPIGLESGLYGGLGANAGVLFVHAGCEQHASLRAGHAALKGHHGECHAGKSCLHVAGATAIEPAIVDLAGEGIARPAIADRYRVAVTGEQQRRAFIGAPETDEIGPIGCCLVEFDRQAVIGEEIRQQFDD